MDTYAFAQRAIEAAELHADGFATDSQLAAECLSVSATVFRDGVWGEELHAYRIVADLTTASASLDAARVSGWVMGCAQNRSEKSAHCALIRDIFGNPFRPISFAPEWRTDTATAIAQQMYESRDFSAMPILADALQDAGCDAEELLRHCRDATQVHVRGCWAVDLVLGRE